MPLTCGLNVLQTCRAIAGGGNLQIAFVFSNGSKTQLESAVRGMSAVRNGRGSRDVVPGMGRDFSLVKKKNGMMEDKREHPRPPRTPYALSAPSPRCES